MITFNKAILAVQHTFHGIYNRYFHPFFHREKDVLQDGKCCVFYLDEYMLYLLHADLTGSRIRILDLETYSFSNPKDLSRLIGILSRQYALQDIPLSWILNENDYQLFFLESLSVPEAEIKSALSWRLKSSLQKIGDTVLDYFQLPGRVTSPEQALITAVASSKLVLEGFVEVSKKFRLNLQVIDIPELALRNLTQCLEDDEKSTALIYIKNNHCILNITKQKILYLTRKISVLYNGKDSENNLHDVSLEVLRYFDYFQNYWRFPAPTRIYLISDESIEQDIIEKLSNFLSIKIEPFSLNCQIVTPKPITGKSWLLLGELLREHTYAASEH